MIINYKSNIIKVSAIAFLCLNSVYFAIASEDDYSINLQTRHFKQQYMKLIWEELLFDNCIDKTNKKRNIRFWDRYEKRSPHQDYMLKSYLIENKQQAEDFICLYLNKILNNENLLDRDTRIDDFFKLISVLKDHFSKQDFEYLEKRVEEIFKISRQYD